MRFKILLFSLPIIIIFSCKKDAKLDFMKPKNNITYCGFELSEFNYIKEHLIPPGDVWTNTLEAYGYSKSVFNPENPYEIAFLKYEEALQGNVVGIQLRKFNFCTLENSLIIDDYVTDFDWGPNGNIIYKTSANEIFKIKDDGSNNEYITTPSDVFLLGNWNISGNTYFTAVYNEVIPLHSELAFMDTNGVQIGTNIYTEFRPLDWINDSTLIGTYYSKIYSFNINTSELIQINSNEVEINSSKMYDRQNNYLYVSYSAGTGNDDYFMMYDLNGIDAVDTISKTYDSYNYVLGDIVDGKIIATLLRRHFKDSLKQIVYRRRNLILMDSDASNEGLVEFQE